MCEDGMYLRLQPSNEEQKVDVQEFLMKSSREKDSKKLSLSPIHSPPIAGS
jgi:hypothetical protein